MTLPALADLRAFVIDMDGVLWEGDRALPGLAEFFAAMRARGLKFILATNNPTRSPEQYQAKLAGFGVAVEGDEVLTSAQAAALYLRARAEPGTRVFVIGQGGLPQALAEQGFVLTGLYDVSARYVVVGMDHGLSWDKLATATLNIRAGAVFVGANPDRTFPTERGVTHGNGAVLAALQAATDVAPVIMGKPEPRMYQVALERLGVEPAAAIAIGDRLETDILGAQRAGLRSILTLSGVTSRAELERSEIKPTWVVEDIREVTRILQM